MRRRVGGRGAGADFSARRHHRRQRGGGAIAGTTVQRRSSGTAHSAGGWRGDCDCRAGVSRSGKRAVCGADDLCDHRGVGCAGIWPPPRQNDVDYVGRAGSDRQRDFDPNGARRDDSESDRRLYR